MFGTLAILVLSILFFVLQELGYSWCSPSSTNFSKSHVKNGQLWTFITATFMHDGIGHLVNNMIMFCAYSFAFEEHVFSYGSSHDKDKDKLVMLNATLVLVVCYVLTGIAGWCCTYVFNEIAYAEIADAMWSCGSSPATYGCLFFFALTSFQGRGEEGPTGALITFPPPTLSLLVLASFGGIFSSNLKHPLARLFHPRVKLYVSIPVLIYLCMLLLDAPRLLVDMSASNYCSWYLIYTALLRISGLVFHKQTLSFPGADNAAHFGGASCGLLLAAFWLFYREYENDVQNNESQKSPFARLFSIFMLFVYNAPLALSYSFLLVRMLTNF